MRYYFADFVSNTLAGGGNQSFFDLEKEDKKTGRLFFKLFSGGMNRYILFYSNIIDSTFRDGSKSKCNMVCGNWHIYSLKVGICKDVNDKEIQMTDIQFKGKKEKDISFGEFFCTDPFTITAEDGDLMCVEIEFSGEKIPYMEEIMVPSFVLKGDVFVSDNKVPYPGFIGCDRYVNSRIAFLGDSITEGIGTECGKYENWVSKVAEELGKDYAYWNLGIGCGRASDASSGGLWIYKAQQNDFVNVCFGVNDILNGASAESVKCCLKKIVSDLKNEGCRVGIFTIPPFDLEGDYLNKWKDINEYIKNELSKETEYAFDTAAVLGKLGEEHMAQYGGHPDKEGCQKLADAFVKFLIDKNIKF